MKQTSTRAIAAIAALSILLTAGCSARDRAGGEAADTAVTLTFAQANDAPPDQLIGFADKVASATHGMVTITFQNRWRHTEPEYEVGTIKDVQDGTVDMAWVGARAFDKVGVTSFQALVAPMLIDSQDLQAKVFDAGVPQEMLAGLDTIGLVGVAVLPGPMRKPLSKGEDLTTPDTFKGKNVGIQASVVAEETFAALGATTTHLPSGADISGVDAYEEQVSTIWGNHYEEKGARSIVGNLNFWPRPLVVFMGKDAYASLSDAQRATLRQASADALAPALRASRDEDTGAVQFLCRSGVTLPAASEADLDALRKAVTPVYDQIAKDAKSAAWLDRIERLKTDLAVGPDTVACPATSPTTSPTVPGSATPSTTTAGGGLPDGTYRALKSRKDFADCGAEGLPDAWLDEIVVDGDIIRQYAYDGTDPSTKKELGFVATYRIFKGTIELIESGTLPPLVFDYTFDGTSLQLSNLRHEGAAATQEDWCGHTSEWTHHPWTRITG